MKQCSKCGAQLRDDAAFCPGCGTPCGASGQGQQPYAGYQQPATFQYEHTASFEASDISYNKVICMAIYLLGIGGIVIAMLAGTTSAYVSFNVREALKITVTEILVGICGVLLMFTIIALPLAAICEVVLFVVRIICFFNICSGKAVEAPIVRSLGFMR